ncbi:hypothetical protein GCM10020216_071330 [Nonomuraea helvata]
MAEASPVLRGMIRDRLGAIMTNPTRIPNVTCDICTAPVPSQYTKCYRCYADAHKGSVPVARRVVPLTYAVVGTQADRDMYRYKDPMPDGAQRLRNPSYQRLLLLLLGFANVHASCLDVGARRHVTGVTVVPSLRGRAGTHPLATLAAVLPGHWEWTGLNAAPESSPTASTPWTFVLSQAATASGHDVLASPSASSRVRVQVRPARLARGAHSANVRSARARPVRT